MSLVGLESGKYARPSSSSALIRDHRFVLPVYFQDSFSQVSMPNSPSRGTTWNVHRGLPVRTSKACTSPGGCSLTGGRSVMLPPVITTSPQTCGPAVESYVAASGPRPAFKLRRPPSPHVVIAVPVLGSSATRYSPRMTKIRASVPSVQYATLRVLSPASPS